jgi:hypothetical protein
LHLLLLLQWLHLQQQLRRQLPLLLLQQGLELPSAHGDACRQCTAATTS